MNLAHVYVASAAVAAVVALNASYVRRRGFGTNPEDWVIQLVFAFLVGMAWPAVIAVVPARMYVKHALAREERRHVRDATVEQLADEEARRVR